MTVLDFTTARRRRLLAELDATLEADPTIRLDGARIVRAIDDSWFTQCVNCATGVDMGRQREQDRGNVTTRDSGYVAMRLTPNEEHALSALVDIHQTLADDAGIVAKIGAASVLRALLKREAVAKGVWPQLDLPFTEPVKVVSEPISEEERRLELDGLRQYIVDLVLSTVRRLADPKTGLASVPAVVRDVTGNSQFSLADVHGALLELDAELELRPWSGAKAMPPADAAMCPKGPKGIALSMIRDRRYAAPAPAPEPANVVSMTVDAESLRKRLVKAYASGKVGPRRLAEETGINKNTIGSFKSGRTLAAEKRMVLAAALERHGF